jgi:hypothetical protein
MLCIALLKQLLRVSQHEPEYSGSHWTSGFDGKATACQILYVPCASWFHVSFAVVSNIFRCWMLHAVLDQLNQAAVGIDMGIRQVQGNVVSGTAGQRAEMPLTLSPEAAAAMESLDVYQALYHAWP